MKFIFIRHAESEANKGNVMADAETPLTPEGSAQAEAAAQEFSLPVDVIFSSPLRRARETAEPFARKLGLNIKIHEDLIEKSYGSLIGKTYEELRSIIEQHPEFHDPKWGSDYRHWGGEAGTQVRDRMQRFVEEIKRTYADKAVLAVTHTVNIRMMHWLYGTQEQEHYFKIPNLSLHEFDL